jgi:glycine oxidase
MHDCLIMGGGVIGLSIAYELATHGLQVQVIDRSEMGREASWAGAGILPPANLQTAVDPIDRLRGLSHPLHAQWARQLKEETGIDNGYHECGGIYLARQQGEAASLHAFAQWLQEDKIDVLPLSTQDLIDREPALNETANAGSIKAAYLVPAESQCRNPDHLKALVQACRQRGVLISEHLAAHAFNLRGNQIESVATSAGELQAGSYCITSGAWTGQLLKQLSVPNGILPVRGQMILYRCPERLLQHIVNEGTRYLVPRNDGRLLVGSCEEEVGFDKSTTAEMLTELTTLAESLVPQLQSATVERSWAGLRPGSFDGFPYLGPIPGLEHAFVAAGHFRSGLHLSTGTAVTIGQLIRGLEPAINLDAFRVGRG